MTITNTINSIIKKTQTIPWRILSPFVLFSLYNQAQVARFKEVSHNYTSLLEQIELDEQSTGYASTDDRCPWQDHINVLRRNFSQTVPIGFLRNSIIRSQMFLGGTRDQLKEKLSIIESQWYGQEMYQLIHEDYIGLPRIMSLKYRTSSNRVHHASHLAEYCFATDKNFKASDIYVEWGGGYGDLARLVRKLNPKCTYSIIDLPEISIMQYIYLYALLGNEVHLVTRESQELVTGKINIIPVWMVLEDKIDITCETFLSTWALTESPQESQDFVREHNFFDAKNMLLAFHDDAHNHIKRYLPELGLMLKNIPFLSSNHYYAFL